METDQQNTEQVQWATLCQDADASINTGNFAWAEHLLEVAFVISTEEQKLEIKAAQERCRWARVLRGVDTSKKNPFVSTLQGFGPRLYGERDHDPDTRSYVANHWLTFLFVPIFPLGAYRVTEAFRSHSILGRVPLPGSLRKARWVIAISVIVLALIPLAIPRQVAPRKIVAPPPNHAEPPKALAPTPISAPAPASEIEKEQPAARPLDQALQDRKRKLDVEGASLEKEKAYLARVEASYQGETVPDGGHAVYQAVLTAYNGRMARYNRDLSEWKKDFAATQPTATAQH